MALLVLGTCGFGFSFRWDEPARTASGEMAVQEAMRTVADSYMLQLFAPKWVRKLPFEK